jgi:hypothetical protein
MATSEVQEQCLDIIIYESDELDRKKSPITLPHNSNEYLNRKLQLTPFTTALPATITACLIRSEFMISEFTASHMMDIFKQIQGKEDILDEEFSIVKLNNMIQNANMSANVRNVDIFEYLQDLENLKETGKKYIQGM